MREIERSAFDRLLKKFMNFVADERLLMAAKANYSAILCISIKTACLQKVAVHAATRSDLGPQ